jgi:hypothetical protein
VSAALKRPPEPTPFASPERAQLAHAIARAADATARRAALGQAAQTANSDVLRAISAAEAAEAVLAEAQGNTARYMVDKALGTAGAAPMTISQARAAAIRAQDHLEECRATRAALKSELDAGDNGLAAMLVSDAAVAVLRSETRERAVALAAEVAALQQKLVERGSALTWLAKEGVFPMANGRPADDATRSTVWRLEVSPSQWEMGSTVRNAHAFAVPTGANALEAAFAALKLDATTPLPED